MTGSGFTLFETPIGRCAIAWGKGGVTALRLPDTDDTATLARLLARAPGAAEARPGPAIAQAIADVSALLSGEPRDLSKVGLDMDALSPFDCRVYAATRTIPPGSTLSYGRLAARIGASGAAREVGRALGRNPFPLLVPCHRVVAADGRLGGFSAPGGARTKRRLLAIEAALADDLFSFAGGAAGRD
ncbi:methylated-DNA--[protein]-cysteine S-methyltransferase [Arenibaculum pallidiluteum]|uniref:methylated-DNA--[protein]-cysteine S-methyltransferase n=1 Tax=Arenibaculum pallidiluteum TaxID=2812559 RepID=UPI001A95BF30|nr:methylated-DNA--[protein]-cysteine S-methyltransferase [Arenibaculum pallidiluteum]